MTNRTTGYGDRRRKSDRRAGKDRRSGEERRAGLDRRSGQDRRSSLDRRSGKDRRTNWTVAEEQRFQGVMRAAETVTHLFSQPLTVIMGYVDLLTAGTRDAELQKKLRVIKEQLGVLGTYLENLRQLSEYRTVDFGDLTLLDIGSKKGENDLR
jgi:signal transduction histidine kinase